VKSELLSAVVMAWRKGFIAHLRFSNRFDDVDLSADNKYAIHKRIDSYMRYKGFHV
jgi:hypothetical protein